MKIISLVLLVLGFSGLRAQFTDNFDDNKSGWFLEGSDACARKIENGKDEHRKMNRRVEFKILKT